MKAVALRAHFGGERICLDEPFELQPGTPVTVVVPVEPFTDPERADWLRLSQQRLAEAYGDDKPEYPLSLVKEPNPDYEGKPAFLQM